MFEVIMPRQIWESILNIIRQKLGIDENEWIEAEDVEDKLREIAEGKSTFEKFLKGDIVDIVYPYETMAVTNMSYWGMDSFEAPNIISLNVTFYSSYVQKVVFENLTSINTASAFESCKYLQEIYMPKLSVVTKSDVFRSCTGLKKIEFPSLGSLNSYLCYNCTSLESAVFMACKNIGSQALGLCNSLKELVIGTPDCTLSAISNLPNTFLEQGAIFVPDDAVDWYKSATNWSNFAEIIKPISERSVNINE